MNTHFKVIGLTRLGIKPQVYRSRSRRSIPLGHLIGDNDLQLSASNNYKSHGRQITWTTTATAKDMISPTFISEKYRLNARIVDEQWRSKGGGGDILVKLYVIIFHNYFEQLLLSYVAYLLVVNHHTVLPSAQAQSCANGPRHLVYALVYFREYKKDLILMCIMSQLRTVFFFVALLAHPRGGYGAMDHPFGSVIRC